jgi:hypothetical protein
MSTTATVVTTAVHHLLLALPDDSALAFYADDPEDGALVLTADGIVIQVTPIGTYVSASLHNLSWEPGIGGNAPIDNAY